MEQWEYLTETIHAHIDNEGARELLEGKWPGFKPAECAPQTMMPHLNARGKEGWELVHMQPVAGNGKKSDIYFNGMDYVWSNAYFCVFKRRTVT